MSIFDEFFEKHKNLFVETHYPKIVAERNRRLESSKETGDYDFVVAHGLTEALRIIDGVYPFWEEENGV